MPETPLHFPRELTDDLRDVLGTMIFSTCKMAHAFRAAGRAEIAAKTEHEQAFVLHWLVCLVLEHGPEWRKHAGETLQVVIQEAEERRKAKHAAFGGRDAP